MNRPLLEIKNISKFYDKEACLEEVSFNINSGEFLVLAGSNGSGKTILMKHLNGLFPIKKNTIYFEGEDCYKKETLMKKRVGIVFQNPDTQIVGLTVKDDIDFGPINLGIKKVELENITKSVMERLNIKVLADRNPHTLSGGELKKVTIAGVLAMSPDIIILDEPFIGLDYPGVLDVTKALIDLNNQGETLIVITHDLEKILKYASRLIVLKDGKIKYNGEPENSLGRLEEWGIRRPIQKNVSEMSWLK